MNKNYKIILALVLALAMMICMCACGDKKDDAAAADAGTGTQTEETSETADAEAEEEEEEAERPEVVKTLEGIDDEETLGPREPLMIDSITLYDDGSLAIVPTEDLRKNEIKDDAEAVYPFEESGKVKNFWVVDYGNGGYRTIIALMKDGSVSAANGRALVEDHIFAVLDNVGNKDNFKKVESRQEEDAYTIIGITDDGEEVMLDYSLNFDEPEE